LGTDDQVLVYNQSSLDGLLELQLWHPGEGVQP